jgi:hypothetical protein
MTAAERKAQQSRSQKALYARRKLAGVCTQCGAPRDGEKTKCRNCLDRNQKSIAEYRARNPDANRWHAIKSIYGITRDQWHGLLRSQDGACAICQKVVETGQLRVDHNHETGVVRGLLCNNCNAGIGMLGDSPVVVERAAQYLRNANRNWKEIAS